MPHKDPERRSAYAREYQRKRLAEDPDFKAAHAARVKAVNERALAGVAAHVSAFRAGGCKVCGETEPACLSAHHLDPSQKEFDIGAARARRFSAKRVEAELRKCVCLCHNCHAKVHAGVVVL